MKPEVCFSFTIFWVFLVALTSKSRSPSALCISAFGLVNFTIALHFFFFFSSRRRHTRYWRDWSSDVCSSDLAAPPRGRRRDPEPRVRRDQQLVVDAARAARAARRRCDRRPQRRPPGRAGGGRDRKSVV